MTHKGLIVLVAGIAAGIAGGVAAVPPLPPGYTWGLGNCGPGVNETRRQCQNCCSRGMQDGTINATERDGCLQACQDSVFPKRHGFWGTVSLWLFA